jgi:CHAD domain-containing protein
MITVAKNESAIVARVPLVDQPGVVPGDVMSEAGRKILGYHFARMLTEEPAVRAGGDIEAIHDMRVATRRMRSALNLFRPFYDKATIKPLRRDLRAIARALGAVRDLDVFRLEAEQYAESLSPADRAAFQPLLDNWRQQENSARAPLIELLNSARYARFLERFQAFVTTPGYGALPITACNREGDPAPSQIGHIAPQLIYTQYNIVRAYETQLGKASPDMLHHLRIEVKRLRYMLEAFTDILGGGAKPAIDATKALQNHLGELQDARVAIDLLQAYLRRRKKADSADGAVEIAAVRAYLGTRRVLKRQLTTGVPAAWSAFVHPDVRRNLALAVAAL